ncbi:MAG TPA: hypothetical protein VI759_00080 [Dehalococcoidia bacterium]|nr:hypothetical protein [Dehalococcoidia bacterium]
MIELAVITLIVSLLAVHYARRAALAAEKQNDLFQGDLAAREEKRGPNVEVEVLTVRIGGGSATGATVILQAQFTNHSSTPDTVQDLTVQFDGRDFRWPPAHPRLQGRKEAPTVPFGLESGVPQNYFYDFNTEPNRLQAPDGIPAVLVAGCKNAGQVSVSFVVPFDRR